MPTRSSTLQSLREGYSWGGVALTLALVLVLSVVHALQPEWLDYDRTAIEAGAWWRLLTAHYVHLNAAHATMNLAALGLVLLLLWPAASLRGWFVVYAAIALATSLALLVLHPELVRYVGASGVIHGLILFGALRRLTVARWESLLLIVGIVGKLCYEAYAGPMAGSASLIGAPVIIESHRYGAIAGAVLGAGSLFWPTAGRSVSRPREL